MLKLVELASGVDALYLSGRGALRDTFVARLAEGRERAEKAGVAVPIDHGGVEFLIAPHGLNKYRYRLAHEYGLIGVTPSDSLPAFYIQPRAEFLHAVGPVQTCLWFARVIEADVGPLLLSVSRVDLFADVQGWSLDGNDRSRFVCRADKRNTHEDGEQFNGLAFGRRASGGISARIYDKTIDATEKGADYWPDIWGDAFQQGQPVLRVEFEFARRALREFGLDGPDEVLAAAGSLWASVTDSWLTFRTPTEDETRSRWPLAPEWEAIQRARIRHDAAGIERVFEGKRSGDLRKMTPQLYGWLVTYGAIIDVTELTQACARLAVMLRMYGAQTGRSFDKQVAARKRERIS